MQENGYFGSRSGVSKEIFDAKFFSITTPKGTPGDVEELDGIARILLAMNRLQIRESGGAEKSAVGNRWVMETTAGQISIETTAKEEVRGKVMVHGIEEKRICERFKEQ